MERRLIKALSLLVSRSGDGRERPGKAVAEFLQLYGIGEAKGAGIVLNDADRATIRQLVRVKANIDLSALPHFDTMSRSEASKKYEDEKITRQGPRASRVAVRAWREAIDNLPSRRACLDMDVDDAITWAAEFAEALIVVENWEAFENIHSIDFDLGVDVASIVVYRGDQGAYPIAAAERLVIALALPVHVFADLDPAGIVLATTYPQFVRMILPPTERIEALASKGRNRDRFHAQAGSHVAASRRTGSPESGLWEILQAYQSAIPQEVFILNDDTGHQNHAGERL